MSTQRAKPGQAPSPPHALRRKRGVVLQDVDQAWLQKFVPTLAPEYRYGVFAPDAAHVVDPGALCDGLLNATESLGGASSDWR